MSILTKWFPAGQRDHDSRSKFSTHTGNVTYSFYLTQLHRLSLSEPSFTPTEAQGADSNPSPHKQNISLLWHQFCQSNDPSPALQNGLCFNLSCADRTIMSLHPTAGHLTLFASKHFQKLRMPRTRKCN